MESWAALRIISVQARSTKAAGHDSGGRNSADSGSASRSMARSARAAACFTSTRLEPTPISRLERNPDRSSPRHSGSPSVGADRRYSGERADRQVELALGLVGLGHHPAQPRLGAQVVGAVHQQEGVPGPDERTELLQVGLEPAHQCLGVVGEGGAVAVPGHQVLGPDPGSVRGCPAEGVAVDRRGHAPPHHGVLEPGLGQDLGHLGHVAEHVGQVAHLHGPTEGRGPPEPGLQVPDDGLARHQELVHQDVPGTDGDPPGPGEGGQPGFVLRTDLEVVVDGRQLAVEEEVAVGAVLLHLVEEAVDEPDQLQAEGLVRLVPLPVPVGVGDHRHPAGCPRRRLLGGHDPMGPYSAS